MSLREHAPDTDPETKRRRATATKRFSDRLIFLKATIPGADRTGTWIAEAKKRGLVS